MCLGRVMKLQYLTRGLTGTSKKLQINIYFQVLIEERKSHKSGPQWKFAGSFYFSLVVLALIGNNHSHPVSIQ